MRTKLSLQNKEVKAIIKACYPDYKGRKVYFSDQVPTYDLTSYWDGGSRTYYVFYQPATGKVWHLGSNHPWFESQKPVPNCKDMPESVCLVSHDIFCGKDLGITIYAKLPVVKEIE